MSRLRDRRRRSSSASRSAGGHRRRERLDAQLGPRVRVGERHQVGRLQRRLQAVDVRRPELQRRRERRLQRRRWPPRPAPAAPRRPGPAGAAPPGWWRAGPRDSSSSTFRSQLRVTRKAAVCSTAKPGNSSPTYSGDQLLEQQRSVVPAAAGSGTSAASTLGTCTTASDVSPRCSRRRCGPSRRSSTATFSDLLRRWGNGWPGIDRQRRQRREHRRA